MRIALCSSSVPALLRWVEGAHEGSYLIASLIITHEGYLHNKVTPVKGAAEDLYILVDALHLSIQHAGVWCKHSPDEASSEVCQAFASSRFRRQQRVNRAVISTEQQQRYSYVRCFL